MIGIVQEMFTMTEKEGEIETETETMIVIVDIGNIGITTGIVIVTGIEDTGGLIQGPAALMIEIVAVGEMTTQDTGIPVALALHLLLAETIASTIADMIE